MTLPTPYRDRLITACCAVNKIAAIDGVLIEARRHHPECFVSAEEERIRIVAYEALSNHVAQARDASDWIARRADMHTILAALRRGLSLETTP